MSSLKGVGELPPATSVGVMLATYDGEKFVAEQIDSILNQEGVETALYVRDDGSTDGTLDILRAYAEAYPGRLSLLDTASSRFGAACGNFLSMLVEIHGAPHAYFAFADQDDIWLPRKLERAVRMLNEKGASGYASNLVAFSDAKGIEWTVAKAQPQRPFDHLFQSASAGCTYVFDRQAAALIYSRIGRVEDHDWKNMSHDWLCYAICRSHGLPWVIDEWAGIRYRQHEQNQFGALPGSAGAFKRMSLMRQGWYRSIVLRNRAFLNSDNAAEQAVLDRVARLDVGDRLWLATNARKLRRELKAQLALAGAVLTGLI
ncbi:glycosyltransferase [Sphingopyxis sp.]|uniref:glycosyltransferase n=1 Tax=Sphingopyxis sp. TaxID=1908224 RepID=UPI001DB42C7F|nr:glycosyltransferase [Sphingopyxis sp.]MBW8295548.1 glycosyltransferase [Sphingopyxis sp.]